MQTILNTIYGAEETVQTPLLPKNNEATPPQESPQDIKRREDKERLDTMMARVQSLEEQAKDLIPTAVEAAQVDYRTPQLRLNSAPARSVGRMLLAGGLAIALPTALTVGSGALLATALGISGIGIAVLAAAGLARLFLRR